MNSSTSEANSKTRCDKVEINDKEQAPLPYSRESGRGFLLMHLSNKLTIKFPSLSKAPFTYSIMMYYPSSG